MQNGPRTGQNPQPNQPPVVAARPGRLSPEQIEANRRANIANWEQSMATRAQNQALANVGFSIVGSFLFGLFTAACSFGLAYGVNSLFGNFIKLLLVQYPTVLLKSVLPAILVPYSMAILIACPALAIGWSLYYGYKTQTLGFSNPDVKSLIKAVDKFFHAAPFLFVLGATGVGFAPIVAFKAACVFGTCAGLYLTVGKQVLAQFYPQYFGPEDPALQAQAQQAMQNAHAQPAAQPENPGAQPVQGQVPQQATQTSAPQPANPVSPSSTDTRQPAAPTTSPLVQEPVLSNFERTRGRRQNQTQERTPENISQNDNGATPRRSTRNPGH